MQVLSVQNVTQNLKGNRQGMRFKHKQGLRDAFLGRFEIYVFFIKKHIDWMIIKSINGIDVLNKWINVATLLIKNLPIFAFSPNAHHYYQTGVLQNLQRKQLCFSIERFKNQKAELLYMVRVFITDLLKTSYWQRHTFSICTFATWNES